MNEQYYQSDQLVSLIHTSLGGFHPGYRDDPILAARRGVYEASVAHRTGGWKGREGALERFRAQETAATPSPAEGGHR